MQVSTIQLVELDLDSSATTKDAAVDRLVAVAAAAGRASDPAALRADVAAREELLPTGIEGGIGIPHARSTGIDEPTVVFGRSTNGIDWGPRMAPPTWCSSSPCLRAPETSTCRSWPASRAP